MDKFRGYSYIMENNSDDDKTFKDNESESDGNETIKGNVFEDDDDGTIKDYNSENDIYESFVGDDYDYRIFMDDLRIFAYEMHHYLMARRYCRLRYPDPIPVTEGSEFTEEFGKSVLATWISVSEKFEATLDSHYPRFTRTERNFKKYVKLRVREITNEPVGRTDIMMLTQQIIMATAFLFDIYVYCYDKAFSYEPCYLPHFVDFWPELFFFHFSERFFEFSDWANLRKECFKMSKSYDQQGVEKVFGTLGCIIDIDVKYFKGRDKTDCKEDCSHRKLVSRFHTVNNHFEKVLPINHRGTICKRQETINVTYKLRTQQEVVENFAPKRINCTKKTVPKKGTNKSKKEKRKTEKKTASTVLEVKIKL